jgi:elongation factor Ts
VAKNDDFHRVRPEHRHAHRGHQPGGDRRRGRARGDRPREKEIYRAQALEMGKPEAVVDKIVEGKIDKFFKENCLMDQAVRPRSRDERSPTCSTRLIGKIGENLTIQALRALSGGGVPVVSRPATSASCSS